MKQLNMLRQLRRKVSKTNYGKKYDVCQWRVSISHYEIHLTMTLSLRLGVFMRTLMESTMIVWFDLWWEHLAHIYADRDDN